MIPIRPGSAFPWECSRPEGGIIWLGSTDGLTVLARIEKDSILVYYQLSLQCGMYPAGKVDISHEEDVNFVRENELSSIMGTS